MNIKFTVGEFAAIHKISKQTLIYYDSIGLLHPKMIDEGNGYRYYTADQFEEMDSILMLKEIGIPLRAIKEFLSNRDLESTVNLLISQKVSLSQKIERLKLLEERLDEKIATIKALEDCSVNYEPQIRKFPQKNLLIRRVAPPNDPVATDIELKKLIKQATDEGHVFNYQIGVMINKSNLLQGKFLTSEKVFTTVRDHTQNKDVVALSEKKCATIYHRGRYDKIGESYGKVIDFINKLGYSIKDYSYEFCVLDNLTTPIRDEYLTEIVIPLT